jgi:hypothetical protein
MSFDLEKLYALLPAVYRIRDIELAGQLGLLLSDQEEAELQDLLGQGSKLSAEEAKRRRALLEKKQRAGGPLKALLSVIAEQIAVLEEDLDQLYDNQFIETCAEWVVPYIGDLVSTRGLFVFPNAPFSQRAQVANTLAYRRRKGTAAVLEQLARDVTGWDASVVEYFQLLATTQYMNHLRPQNLSVTSLRHRHFASLQEHLSRDNLSEANERQWQALEYINTPFDTLARTVDVRNIESRRGKYNIPNIGIYLWRLANYAVTNAPAFKVDAHRYLFDALGKDTPLYNRPETEDQITHLAETLNVPMPISRHVLDRYLDTYYGVDARGVVKSILLNVDGQDLLPGATSPPHASPPASQLSDLIHVCDLSDLQDSGGNVIGWAHTPPDSIAIDPILGRIAFPDNVTPATVHVTYHYGFSAEMGGGEYGRAGTFTSGLQPVIEVPSGEATSIQGALVQLSASGGVVEVAKVKHNEYHIETPVIHVAARKQIELRAADEHRPVLVLTGDLLIAGGDEAEVTLNGLLISGGSLRVPLQGNNTENQLRRLRLRHCTLLPGPSPAIQGVPAQPAAPRLIIEAPNVIIEIDRCILGAIRASDGAQVHITNSIVDAGEETAIAYMAPREAVSPPAEAEALPLPGAPLHVENSTIIGQVHTVIMELASNTIFFARLKAFDAWPAPVLATRLQQGCVRFSYVPPGAQVPRPYHCQPTNIDEAARVRPVFTSLRYGDAGYGQLSQHCAVEIRQGADDEAEMGAFHDLYQPQREANLRARLEEYLRFGLEAGIFYAS